MFKILVAEDDASTNRLFCAILRRAGYDPVPAFDGEEALEKPDEQQVDLLLCDVMMPKLDGFALTQTMSSRPPSPHWAALPTCCWKTKRCPPRSGGST